MPIYGIGSPVSLYPGTKAFFVGTAAVPGTPIVAAGEALAAGVASRPLVIAARPGGMGSTQRTFIWRVFGTGALNVSLQASIDDVDANYNTIDNYTGTGPSGNLTVQADAATGAEGTSKILSSARFLRVVNSAATLATFSADGTAQ